jgi:hypothetical protein
MWKEQWEQLQERFDAFWQRKGHIVSMWNGYVQTDQVTCPNPEKHLVDIAERMRAIERSGAWEQFYTDAELVASHQRNAICHGHYPGDFIPFAYCDWGTVTLAPMLGAQQHFSKETVWYTHEQTALSPEDDRPLILHDDDRWFTTLQDLARVGTAWAKGKYLCGLPAVCGGLDVLAELRGASELCMDLVLEPDWVKQKLQEIDAVNRKAFNTLYEVMRDEDGSVFHAFFMFWARGRAALIQCDFAALISEEMFREFAVPWIRAEASRLDYSLYHVDGPDALRTVDALLEIEELDCIEFTPGPQVPQGGDEQWYPLYRKIKEAGKCVQVVQVQPNEVEPLLDAIGTDGVYVMY